MATNTDTACLALAAKDLLRLPKASKDPIGYLLDEARRHRLWWQTSVITRARAVDAQAHLEGLLCQVEFQYGLEPELVLELAERLEPPLKGQVVPAAAAAEQVAHP